MAIGSIKKAVATGDVALTIGKGVGLVVGAVVLLPTVTAVAGVVAAAAPAIVVGASLVGCAKLLMRAGKKLGKIEQGE